MNVVIDARYCGPPTSGNGGYSCGLLAAQLTGPVEVTLKAPPPLGVPLDIEPDDGGVNLSCAGTVIAQARAVSFEQSPPGHPGAVEAQAAAARYAGFHTHAFPTCFTCGPARAPHDGLRVFSGLWRDGIVASPWTVDASLADAQGHIPVPVLWAAIDCPGYWACVGDRDPPPTMVLGRMTARIDAQVAVGEQCVVMGWPLGSEGRKHFAGTALFGADGRLIGQSRQTWIALKQAT